MKSNFVGIVPGLDVITTATQVFQNGIAGALVGNGSDVGGLPYAYMYYLLYDNNFNPVTAGWVRVSTAGGFDPGQESVTPHGMISIPTVTIGQPGYLYAFVVNESEQTRVWFDDFKVTHQRSTIVAGADYYPFGMQIAERVITREDYRWGYQGQYSEMDTLSGFNHFELRMYDSRIGRWISPDPYGQFSSPYLGMGNVPLQSTDPDGGLCEGCTTILDALGNEITVLPEITVTATRIDSIRGLTAGLAFVKEAGGNSYFSQDSRGSWYQTFREQRYSTTYKFVDSNWQIYNDEEKLANNMASAADFTAEMYSALIQLPLGGLAGGGGAPLSASRSISQRGISSELPVLGNKISYVFGKATGSAHNIERSTSMLKQLESIGIFDNASGNAYLRSHLGKALNSSKAILQSNGRFLRESLLMGPNGGLKMESIWEGNKLITIRLLGR